jgi:hypothetical protein
MIRSLKALSLPLAALALISSLGLADTFKCTEANGCEVKLWDPANNKWGEAEHVPEGTIVDSKWAMPWGEGWSETN